MLRRLLCLLLLAAALPLQAFATGVAPTRLTLPSTVLGEERSVQVVLPESYRWAESRRYPVLYLLDGQTHAGHSIGSIGFLAAQGQVPEMIVVAIDSTVRVRDFTQTDWPEAWVGGGGADRFAEFLESELLPRIERDYRTAPFRILSGHSASGQFALHMLATRPALFNAVLAMAPSLDWDKQLPIREMEAALAEPARPARFVYFAYGDDGGGALADDERLARALQAPGEAVLRAVVRHHPAETHGALPLVAQVEGLRALYAGYSLPESPQPPSLAQVQAHYDALGARLGLAVPIPESTLNDLGYRALGRGELETAIALFARAAKENPDSVNAWDSLAEAQAEAKHWPQAVDAAQRALDLATRQGSGDLDRLQGQLAKYRAAR